MPRSRQREINGVWVREGGDPYNFDTIVIMDSQGRGPCENPQDYLSIPGILVLSISGGTAAHVIRLMSSPLVASANFIIIGGLGTNDLGMKTAPTPAPPRVEAVAGPRGSRQLEFGAPTVDTQAPKGKYSDLLRDMKEAYRRKRVGQVFVTFSPFARRSRGPINYHINLFDNRIESFGPDHHHVKTLSYYTARNRGNTKIYGGKRPSKDTLYEEDNVHLKRSEVDRFMYCIAETRSRLRNGSLTTGHQLIAEPRFRVKF